MLYRNQNYIIWILRSKHLLLLYDKHALIQQWPIAVGKAITPTPLGDWSIINKKILSGGIYGTRWLGLSNPSYGIHGTNNPSSIGTDVSLGCIRMHNRHIEALFPLVKIGTEVHILQ